MFLLQVFSLAFTCGSVLSANLACTFIVWRYRNNLYIMFCQTPLIQHMKVLNYGMCYIVPTWRCCMWKNLSLNWNFYWKCGFVRLFFYFFLCVKIKWMQQIFFSKIWVQLVFVYVFCWTAEHYRAFWSYLFHDYLLHVQSLCFSENLLVNCLLMLWSFGNSRIYFENV